ncbi:MAG: hypothetical protein LBJ00_03935 [Planctomycetaceae bacterium]|jgi:hypothetical protein|nr:hypothetical protein [Planctomycetaceae bacterium]
MRRKFLGLFSAVLLFVMLSGCQNVLFTALVLIKGTDVPPECEILTKAKKETRVVVVCYSVAASQYEVQNAPRLIGRQVSKLIEDNCANKMIRMVDPVKVDTWLDNCGNEIDDILVISKDSTINADIVIGIEILDFQTRDQKSHFQIQGRCLMKIIAKDCKTGEVLYSQNLTVVDPPDVPIQGGGAGTEAAFRPKFIKAVSEQVAYKFHPHDQHKARRIQADSLEMF